jgi:hypothetical protein
VNQELSDAFMPLHVQSQCVTGKFNGLNEMDIPALTLSAFSEVEKNTD